MKIDKEFMLDVFSNISEEGSYQPGEKGYVAYEKFKSSQEYKIFLEKELQDEDYFNFRKGYNEILSKFNMPLDEYDFDFDDNLSRVFRHEECTYCNDFALYILDKYVINKDEIRERRLNKILN